MCKAQVCFLIFVFSACSEWDDFSEMVFQGTLYGIIFFFLRQVGLHDARCSEDEAVVPMLMCA